MDVAIKKVSERDGKDRFVLVDVTTREVVTVNDVSEATIRRFFRAQGVSNELLTDCLTKARKDYGQRLHKVHVPASDSQETMGDDDLLFELGLIEDD